MMIFELRQGIGFDIEFNETICHIIDDGGPHDKLYSYCGILIKLPFISIYIGEFDEIGELIKGNKPTGE